MSNPSNAFKTAVLSVGKMSALLASIAMAAVLARLLSKADYGAFIQVITLYTVLSLIFQVGVPQSLYYYMPRLPDSEKRGFAIQGALLLAAQGAVISLILYAGADFIGRAWNSPQLPALLRTFAPYPILMLPIVAMENILVVYNRAVTVAVFNSLAKMAQFTVVVVPIWLGSSMLLSIRLWVLLAAVEIVIAMFLMLRPLRGLGTTFRLSRLRDQYVYALPFGLAAFCGALAAYADKIMVSVMRGPESYAVYVNGAMELPVVGVIAVAVTMTITPTLVVYAKQGRQADFLQLWYRSQQKVAVILFALLGWLIFFAHDAVTLLFSRKYTESAVLFQVYLLLIPARLCCFQSIMVPLRLNWAYAMAQVAQVLLAYILCLILLPMLGLIGAAAGAVTTVYITMGIYAVMCSRALNIRAVDIWAYRQLGLNLVLAIGAGLIAWLALWVVPSSDYLCMLLRLAGGGAVFAVIYFVAGARLGVVRWQELRAVLVWRAPAVAPATGEAAPALSERVGSTS